MKNDEFIIACDDVKRNEIGVNSTSQKKDSLFNAVDYENKSWN